MSFRFLILAPSALLAACANLPADRGYAEVRALAQAHGRSDLPDDPQGDRAQQVQALASQPLNVDGATRLALLNNPGLLALYAELGLSCAELIAASRPRNPVLAASSLESSSENHQYGLSLSQPVLDLLMLRPRTQLAQAEFERTRLQAADQVLELAAQAQSAYYAYVGARQLAAMRAAIAEAAQTSAELAARYARAGNLSALELNLQQAQATQAQVDAESARAQTELARSTLNRVLGLRAEEARWTTAEQLPEVQAEPPAIEPLRRLAAQNRLDLQAAYREVASLEQALGLTRHYRLLGSLDVGVDYERETDRSRLLGPSLSLELPVFHQNQAGIARAQALLDAARARLAAAELDASNGLQQAHDALLAADTRARRYKLELIPQREAVVARMQEQVNAMLMSPFDLIQAKQQEYAAYQGYLEAVRDWWLARVQLERAVGTALPSTPATAPSPAQPPAGGHELHPGDGP
jgi:cobalt-zinc-cadmium efflux system outer membrane protein